MAILRAQFIRTLGALERHIRVLPEPLGVQIDGNFPRDKVNYRKNEQGNREKATHNEHWREHHHMVPVENATGGAAFVAEHKSEGTPNKHANEIANVKRDTDEQEVFTVNNLEELESTYSAYECKPKRHYLARRLVCLNNIALETLLIHELMYCRAEFLLENLLRAERNILHG